MYYYSNLNVDDDDEVWDDRKMQLIFGALINVNIQKETL